MKSPDRTVLVDLQAAKPIIRQPSLRKKFIAFAKKFPTKFQLELEAKLHKDDDAEMEEPVNTPESMLEEHGPGTLPQAQTVPMTQVPIPDETTLTGK